MSVAALAPIGRPGPTFLPPPMRRRHLEAAGPDQDVLAVDFTGEDRKFGPQATAASALPDAGPFAHRMLLGLLEVMNGARRPSQFDHWLSLDLRERLHRAHTVAVRRGSRPATPPQVLRVRVCHPIDSVAEISAVVHDRGRVRAIAMRLSGCDGRWLATELVIG